MARGIWQSSYKRKYGLLVTQQDGLRVKGTRCKFCKYFGREVSLDNRKRGARKTNQFYTEPFRTDVITRHLENQHASKWAEYSALSADDQDRFFDNLQPHANTMFYYLDTESDEINLVLSIAIVEVVIGNMMFRPKDELDADDVDDLARIGDRNRKITLLRRAALQLFKNNEVGNDYTVCIKTVMRFKLAIQHVSCGLSFRQVAAVVEHTRSTCNIAKLGGLSDLLIGQYVRVLVGHALQVFSNILASTDVWSFALSFDGSQHRGTTFFDVRVCVAVRGVLFNLHLIAMPHFDRHTAAHQEAMLVKLLDSLYEFWPRKLIGVTTDGEKTNMGHRNGIQIRMVRRAEFKVIQIWCAPHQLDLVVHMAVDEICGGTLVKDMYVLSTYLRKQSNLITEMNETFPKKTNRWVALRSMLKFYIFREQRIVSYLKERRQQVENADPPVIT
ncbi:unnamed protein product [Sphagnum tenellum]